MRIEYGAKDTVVVMAYRKKVGGKDDELSVSFAVGPAGVLPEEYLKHVKLGAGMPPSDVIEAIFDIFSEKGVVIDFNTPGEIMTLSSSLQQYAFNYLMGAEGIMEGRSKLTH